MKIYVWKHNKKFHSYSMIDEPCINNEFYTSAAAIVLADSKEHAAAILARRDSSWRAEDLLKLEPLVFDLGEAVVIYTNVSGN